MPRSCTAEGCVVNTAGVLCYKHRTHCNTCKERLGGGSKSSKGKCNHCRRGGLCKHPSGCAKRYGNTTGGRKSKLCAGHRRQSSKDDASHADTVVQAPDAGGNGPRTQGLSAAESHRIYLRHDILKERVNWISRRWKNLLTLPYNGPPRTRAVATYYTKCLVGCWGWMQRNVIRRARLRTTALKKELTLCSLHLLFVREWSLSGHNQPLAHTIRTHLALDASRCVRLRFTLSLKKSPH